MLEVGRGIQTNLQFSAKIIDFARLSFGMKFFLRKLTVSANAVVVGFCAGEFFLQRKCRFSERSRRQIFRNRKHVIVLKCHASCRNIFVKKNGIAKTHLANAEIGNRKYI